MEIVREKWIQDFAEMLSDVPVKLKRDTLSSVDLQLGAKIARLIEHIRRLQYEALTASAIEVPPEQAVSTAHEIAVSARSEQPGSSEPSTTEENNVRTGFLEHAEYLALRDELPEELKMLLVIGYYTGVRRGELINIKWNEVDMKARRIRLDVGTTKNKEGRYLPIYAEMAEWIEMARSIRNEKFPNCPWLFHRSGERILNFRKAWETARTAAGLPEILVHDLRRTAARNMVRAGIPEKIVMMITGHKTRAMLDRYNIVNDRDLDLAADRMDAHLGTLSGTPEDVGTKSKGKEKIVSPLN